MSGRSCSCWLLMQINEPMWASLHLFSPTSRRAVSLGSSGPFGLRLLCDPVSVPSCQQAFSPVKWITWSTHHIQTPQNHRTLISTIVCCSLDFSFSSVMAEWNQRVDFSLLVFPFSSTGNKLVSLLLDMLWQDTDQLSPDASPAEDKQLYFYSSIHTRGHTKGFTGAEQDSRITLRMCWKEHKNKKQDGVMWARRSWCRDDWSLLRHVSSSESESEVDISSSASNWLSNTQN